MKIAYEYTVEGSAPLTFEVDLDRGPPARDAKLPAWTALEFHQCQICPLKAADAPHCPPAADLAGIVGDFSRILSHATLDVRVVMNERTVSKRCDAQTGLKALMGLVMATSACPVFHGFRTMAQFHLPFATLEETIVRAVSLHLMKKLYRVRDGATEDWSLEGLLEQYRASEATGAQFTDRVHAGSEMDANLNAIVNLNADSMLITNMLDDILGDLAPLFRSVATAPA